MSAIRARKISPMCKVSRPSAAIWKSRCSRARRSHCRAAAPTGYPLDRYSARALQQTIGRARSGTIPPAPESKSSFACPSRAACWSCARRATACRRARGRCSWRGSSAPPCFSPSSPSSSSAIRCARSRHLADAMERFGRGEDGGFFRIRGAREVRGATHAFFDMRQRIKRHIAQRSQLLAGVSHDLRTPLTRLKLQFALMPPSPEIEDAKRDLAEMEETLDEYLAFAKGRRRRSAVMVDIAALARRGRRRQRDAAAPRWPLDCQRRSRTPGPRARAETLPRQSDRQRRRPWRQASRRASAAKKTRW